MTIRKADLIAAAKGDTTIDSFTADCRLTTDDFSKALP